MNEILEKYPINLSVKEAAKLLNKTEMFVRCGLRANRFNWGSAVLIDKEWSYHISTKALMNYLGFGGESK